MHTEVGFLRSPADGQLEFVLAQPTGQTELLHGHVEDGDGGAVLVFEDSDVVNSRSAKQVDATTRTYTVDLAGETLTTTSRHGRRGGSRCSGISRACCSGWTDD
ncbi:heme-binding beta-barrel domain-containing protein [Corynebacterium suedekumii]|nr:heme-binding beta-barrel domain-containing protein [Corynebacterium suedekumii]